MKHGKLFAVIAIALTACAEVSAQETTNVDSLKQIVDQQQARLDALEQSESTRAEQEGLDKIWKQRKHLTIGIGSQKLNNLDEDDVPTLKSNSAISIQMGKTFSLHKKPIANMVKIGLDWNYIELHYAKYKKFEIEDYDDNEWNSRSGYYYDDEDDDNDWGNLGDLGLSDFGYYQVDLGMAIGPSVQVTPFYSLGKGLEHIKAYTYFHVIPSASGIILSDDDETNFGWGYVTNFSWGIGVSYRSFAIGFETRWGSGKYDTSSFNDEIDEDLNLFQTGDKTKYKTTSSKLTLSLRF